MRMTLSTKIVAATASIALLAGCGWSSNTDEAKSKADTFTQAALASGLAPAMTQQVARSLYGEDGGTVCAALEDDPQSPSLIAWARTNVRGQPKEQAEHVVEYDRIVIETYCPQHLDRFDSLMSDLGYTKPA